MNDTSTAVSRRSVLVSGLAVSLLAAPVAATTLPEAKTCVLSGRLTDAQGQPLRQAQVAVAGAVTRTDGDGRFFMHAVLPTQATLALQILLHGESQAIEVLAAVERSAVSERQDASVSLTMVG